MYLLFYACIAEMDDKQLLNILIEVIITTKGDVIESIINLHIWAPPVFMPKM